MSFLPSDTAEIQQTESVIQNIDLINRELQLRDDWVVLVPPDCRIFLRDDRVKLRLLQPGDHVRLTYRADAASAVARVIEVHFGKS